MVTANVNKRVLLLMDSRGTYMEEEITQIAAKTNEHIYIKVEYKRGDTISSVAEMGSKILKENVYDACFLFAGINNITNKKAKGCELKYDCIQSIYTKLISEYNRAHTILQENCREVIICHLLGMDIARYNKVPPYVLEDEQKIINVAVGRINKNINKMNIDHQVKGPWLEDTIHSTTAKKVIHKYKRLHDGLHPDRDTVRLWAKKLLAAL